MITFPPAAQPVLDIIRRDVPRPKELPEGYANGKLLRWNNHSTCPMGLHPLSVSNTPLNSMSFPPLKNDMAIREFWHFWDSLTEADAAEAVDFIWGKVPPDNPCGMYDDKNLPPWSTDPGAAITALQEYCGERLRWTVSCKGRIRTCEISYYDGTVLAKTDCWTVAEAVAKCIVDAHEDGKERT